jgi:hypothetical protein
MKHNKNDITIQTVKASVRSQKHELIRTTVVFDSFFSIRKIVDAYLTP